MTGANIRKGPLTKAVMNNADLRQADLSGALWIDAIHRCSNQNCDGKAY